MLRVLAHKMRRSRKVGDTVDGDEDSSDDRSSKKINWTAMCLLMLFILPAAATLFLQGFDFLYPEAARIRVLRSKVTRCYAAANPTKLTEVDKIIEKYKNSELRLLAQACNFLLVYPNSF